MNMLVCVKQVPDTTEIKIDPVTNTLIRQGVPSIVNPYDGYALETAARIKDENPGSKIVVLSMGPKQAQDALRECLAVGADKAYLLTDNLFAGSDTLATSYILSRAIAKVQELEGAFDIIFCGKQAIDGDTAQVGPEMAEHLGLPQVSYVTDARKEGDRLVVRKESEESVQTLEVEGPCVLTVLASAFPARYMSVAGIMEAYGREVELWSADRIDVDEERLGLKGSPTKVFQSFPKALKAPGEQFEGSAEEAVELIVRKLKEKHII